MIAMNVNNFRFEKSSTVLKLQISRIKKSTTNPNIIHKNGIESSKLQPWKPFWMAIKIALKHREFYRFKF